MMYKSKLAVALKSAGKVLREFGETVYVPFGSEYSVLIKNMNSHRALVSVTVDGTDVGDGQKFVVNANDSVEIERFIKNGNLGEGNRLKFIERSDNINQHRGIGIEDGLVRIEFNFEKPQPRLNPISWYNNPYGYSYRHPSDNSGVVQKNFSTTAGNTEGHHNVPCNNITRGISSNDIQSQAFYSANVNNVDVTMDTHISADVVNDAGITVPGSVSDQTFQTVSWFPTETETHVIVLQMLGQTEDNQQVTKPVTVKAKPKCTTCGRTNKATAKFCTECGTSLTIV